MRSEDRECNRKQEFSFSSFLLFFSLFSLFYIIFLFVFLAGSCVTVRQQVSHRAMVEAVTASAKKGRGRNLRVGKGKEGTPLKSGQKQDWGPTQVGSGKLSLHILPGR